MTQMSRDVRSIQTKLIKASECISEVFVRYEKLSEENKKLKELLKECVPYVNHRFIETRETLTKPYKASDKALHKKAEKLLTKIDEALK